MPNIRPYTSPPLDSCSTTTVAHASVISIRISYLISRYRIGGYPIDQMSSLCIIVLNELSSLSGLRSREILHVELSLKISILCLQSIDLLLAHLIKNSLSIGIIRVDNVLKSFRQS